MSNECLIDFDPNPACPVWYDDGDTEDDGWNSRETFDDVYDNAREYRLRRRRSFLRVEMCRRILTAEEEIEAHNFGVELADENYKLLCDLWFQQRRLKALKKGLLLS